MEVLKYLSGPLASPVAERRQERVLKDEEFSAYEGMPNLGDGNGGRDDDGLPTDADSDADNQQRPTCHLRERRHLRRVLTP
mgnify:CR=1 FL=1